MNLKKLKKSFSILYTQQYLLKNYEFNSNIKKIKKVENKTKVANLDEILLFLETKDNENIRLAELSSEEIKIEKINEKRRRNQIYIFLNYLLSWYSYIDFLSADALNLIKNAKDVAHVYKCENVSTEFFLVPFLENDTKFNSILSEIESFSGENFLYIKKHFKIAIQKTKKKNNNFFLNEQSENVNPTKNHLFSALLRKKTHLNQRIEFSSEIHSILEKAAQNASTRFRTPVITSEILFLTLMENKKSKASKILNHIFNDKEHFLGLRYKMMNYLHTQESSIRNEHRLNEHFFAYLLKLNISDLRFSALLENELLKETISTFRYDVFSEILNRNCFNFLFKELNLSIRMNSFRTYNAT
jgi:hypothetical protein